MATVNGVDILENKLRRKGCLLDALLLDQSTKRNLIWGTDSYMHLGEKYLPEAQILPGLVTGKNGLLIQPRAAKSIVEQKQRTKDKAEVFTPLHVVDQINALTDTIEVDSENWQDYVKELRLEIACGEAPFIVSRYDPTLPAGGTVKINQRVGFLDKKLMAVSRFCNKRAEWLHWAMEAFKSSYGFEWQGDNVLIARENLLYTLLDYYYEKFGHRLRLSAQQEFAEVISWNIFQMDGLKFVTPMSCQTEMTAEQGAITLFDDEPDAVREAKCEGCRLDIQEKHNGVYAKVMDWEQEKSRRFIDLLSYKNLLLSPVKTNALGRLKESSMIARNASEEKIYKLLLEIGYTADMIQEPDKVNDLNPEKAVDYVLPEIAIEVKEIYNPDIMSDAERMKSDFDRDGYSVFVAPNISQSIKTHLDSTVKKLKNFPDVQSLLIIDISQLVYPPDIEAVVLGSEAIEGYLSDADGERKFVETDRGWLGKLFQEKQYTSIGAIAFLSNIKFSVFHNLSAKKERKLSIHRLCDIANIKSLSVEQFAFYNINRGPSAIRKIEVS